MKKYLYMIVLFVVTLLLFPWNIHAKDLDVSFEKIELVEKSDNVNVLEEPSIHNNNLDLDLDLLFQDVGDSITYKLTIKNDDSKDYYLGLVSEDDYLSCELDNTRIKNKNTSQINLTVKYNKKISSDLLGNKIKKKIGFDIRNKDGKILSNPETSNNLLFVILIIIFIGLTLFVLKNRKHKAMILLFGILLAPFIANAEKMFPLMINITYEVSGESCASIKNAQVKSIIEDNVMTNSEFYHRKKEFLEALNNSPNMPEEYKQYFKMDEVEGNPKCTRNELVEKIEKKVQLTEKQKTSILSCEKINVSGEEIDLRVFDKEVDGIYIDGVKVSSAYPSAKSVKYNYDNGYSDYEIVNYPLFLSETVQNDILPFDFILFNEATHDDFNNSFRGTNRYSLIRNIQIPYNSTFEAVADNSADVKLPITADFTAYDNTNNDQNSEIIVVGLNFDIQTNIIINSNEILVGGYPNNPEWYFMMLFSRKFGDINDIVDDYVNDVRNLYSTSLKNVVLVNNGKRYEGADNIIRVNTLTAEEAMNLINFDCYDYGYCPSGYTYSKEIYDRARAKLEFRPKET